MRHEILLQIEKRLAYLERIEDELTERQKKYVSLVRARLEKQLISPEIDLREFAVICTLMLEGELWPTEL